MPIEGQGRAGDLYLEVSFKPHALYHLEGKDLFLNLPVTPWEAALGLKVKTPTPSGTVGLKIPPNSKTGRKLRLKGRGLPSETPGNLFVVLQVVIPPAITAAEKDFYKSMAETFEFNPRSNIKRA